MNRFLLFAPNLFPLTLTILTLMIIVVFSSNASSPPFKVKAHNAYVPASGERGRVQIVQDGNGFYKVVADNGYPLRGESIFMDDATGSTTGGFALSFLYDDSYWLALRDDFHLNGVRLYMMRPPQNWSGGPGDDCFPPNYRCHTLDYLLNPPDTVLDILDDVVDKAAQMGMYIVIDYHPVGGYDVDDALNWWGVVAPRYQNRTHVIYEAVNEPVGWNAGNYTEADVQFQEDIYAYIRSLAPNTHIILWSFANCNGPMKDKMDLAPDINYSNASGSCHPYSYLQSDVDAVRSNYPFIHTEIGDSVVKQDILRAESIGVSWLGLSMAQTYGLNPNGFIPSEVTWPADPGAVTMATPTPTTTSTGTATATATNTPMPTATSTTTATATSTNTPTPTSTATSTSTNTPTLTAAATAVATNTPTSTGTPMSTATLLATATATATSAPGATPTPSATPTMTASATPTGVANATLTATPTATATAVFTPTSTLLPPVYDYHTYLPLIRDN
jgi:hypothetical protein